MSGGLCAVRRDGLRRGRLKVQTHINRMKPTTYVRSHTCVYDILRTILYVIPVDVYRVEVDGRVLPSPGCGATASDIL